MRAQRMKVTINKSIKGRSEAVPWNNVGRQSDPNAERTLGHVGPTMGGVVTQTNHRVPTTSQGRHQTGTGTDKQTPLKVCTLQCGGQGLARRTTLEHVTPIHQTSPKKIRTLQDYRGDLPHFLSTPSSLFMEDSPNFPCLASHPLQGNQGTQDQLHGTTP